MIKTIAISFLMLLVILFTNQQTVNSYSAIVDTTTTTDSTPSYQDFAVAITPDKQLVLPGENAVFIISSQPIGGFNQPISLTAITSLDGLTTQFDSTSIIPGASTNLTVIVPPSIRKGSSAIITVVAFVGRHEKLLTALLFINSPNSNPTIATIEDQSLVAGSMKTVNVISLDKDDPEFLKLSLLTAPTYVDFHDNGNSTGVIRISPTLTETQGGNVVVQVEDLGGLKAQTSFNIKILKPIFFVGITFFKKNLSIFGLGLSGGIKVFVNNQDVSQFIIQQSDTLLVLKGNKKKLNLRADNEIMVTNSDGVTAKISFSLLDRKF